MQNELYIFVKESLEKNQSKAQIKEALLQAGWKEEEIVVALSLFADVVFPVAVPRPKPYLQAREAFLYLVSFITLYISSFSFGALLFEFIDRNFPDPISGQFYYGGERLPISLASIIVAFPLYLFMARYLKKTELKDSDERESRVKKWLTYVTLVIVATVIIVDLVMILGNLLGGELTVRFILRELTVLYIAVSIFWYYLWDLQRS